MSEPKNHHVLPAFYLRGFCNKKCNKKVHEKEDHEKDNKRCQVWVHDKEKDEIRPRGTKKLSIARHYYSVDTLDGGRDAKPEKALSRLVEGPAAKVIQSLHYKSKLSSAQKASLAVFVATMKFRVSSYRTWSQSYAEQNENDIRKQVFPSVDLLPEYLRRHGNLEAEDPETVEKIFDDIHSGDYRLTLTKNHMLQHMFENSEKVAQVLLGFGWTFDWAPSNASFITSDDPVLVLDINLKAPVDFSGEMGFLSPGATTIMPLSQDVCVRVGSQGHSISHRLLDRETVRKINIEQTKHYERWLVARDEALVERLVR